MAAIEIQARPLTQLSALEVHELYKLRVDVFVAEEGTPYAEIDEVDALETTLHVQLFVDKRLRGTARVHPSLIDGRSALQFGRFALHPTQRGTGLGTRLLNAAINAGTKRHPGPVYLTAQVPLVGYYERHGFRAVGTPYDDTGVPHQPMWREAYSLETP